MARKKTALKPKTTVSLTEQPGIRLSKSSQFPIIGVGASAGGLEAFTQLFRNLPADPGMAFVLIQHLAPAHESMLTELLSKSTSMPVREVKDGMTVAPDNVYIIPPDKEMIIFQGVLHLEPRDEVKGQYMPVDSFLRSLAQDRRHNAIAVILSGTGSDGSMGVRAVKGEGGIVFAQDETAKYDGMPRSAIDTGCVDFVLPTAKIAAELLRISKHPYLADVRRAEPVQTPSEEDDLNRIFIMLRSAKGIDFTTYKRSTIMRRITRRMLLQKIEGIEKYVTYLKQNPSEIETLYQDILINVTSFFREPETFDALKRSVFPHIVDKASGDVPVRIWVPACSTGEEAYSIAIALLEYMDDNKISRSVQLFATDIDDIAVEKARKGIYPENISRDVSPERLTRFFEKNGDGYVINKLVREMCIFAKQNMVKDPPFSKIDLISCRNVLIYFSPELQKKTISILFYALNPKGFLMIGQSETVGEFAGLFSVVDKKHTIYSKKAETSVQYFEAPLIEPGKEKTVGKKAEVQAKGVFDIQKEADTIVLNKYSPAGFVVNNALKILQFRGDTSPYLRPAPGQASLDLLKMVSEDLVSELRTLLHQAKKEDVPVRKERFRVKHDKRIKYINIDIVPFKAQASGERCFLVLFEEIAGAGLKPALTKNATTAKGEPEDEETMQLRQELAASKAHLNAVTQEYETANEELQALNEELQSSNEEMQSINEEMETAKEELQSTNEELTTVNDELQSRNEETMQLNNDLFNVLKGVEIPIVLLGSKLQIRRFNDAAASLLNLIPTDVGRPLSNIRTNINIPDLEQMVLDTINTLAVRQKDVQDDSGHWYSLTIRPYKTVDNRIDGVLMTLVDINDIKLNLVRVREAYDYANAIVETVREPLLVLAPDLRVMTANRSFYANFLTTSEETENRFIYALGDGQWNIPALRDLLEKVLPENKVFSDFEVELELPNIGRRVMILNARKIYLEYPYFKSTLNIAEHFDRLILLAIEDVTDLKKSEEALKIQNTELQSSASNLKAVYKDMETFTYAASHDLKAPLITIEGFSNILLEDYAEKLDDKGKDFLIRINNSVKKMNQLIGDLLLFSRVSTKDILKHDFNMTELAQKLVDELTPTIGERDIKFEIKQMPSAYGDTIMINQVLLNLLSNAIKFTYTRETAMIEAGGYSENNESVYYVRDNGIGFDMKLSDRLFGLFQKIHSSQEVEGTGLGLVIVKNIIEKHGGRVWAEGKPGEGATFYFTLPKKEE
jgi:two-component system CheB/CheR fusion protein